MFVMIGSSIETAVKPGCFSFDAMFQISYNEKKFCEVVRHEMNETYLTDLLIRMAHHSTAIEGNTLTLYETKSVLLENYVPRAVNLREIYEVRNYRELMPYLTEHEEAVSISTVRDLHAILLRDIDDRRGQFKQSQNMILGADFIPTAPYLVPSELKNWADTLEYRLARAETAEEKTEAIMEQHMRFERIHPFPDGNGRTGRALIVYSCLRQGLPPIVIEREQRTEYMNALHTRDVAALTALALRLEAAEAERMKAFGE